MTAVLLSVAVGVAGAFPNDTASWDAAEPAHRRIMVVGDSLVGQSGPAAEALGEQREHAVERWAISGGAPCDVTPLWGQRASHFDGAAAVVYPHAVALAFVGNATSPCMDAELGYAVDCCITSAEVAAITSIYRKHLTAIIRWNQARGVQTWLIAPPLMAAGTWHNQVNASINAMYADLAADEAGVEYSPAARRLLSPAGAYTSAIAGLPVRHSDATHLRAPYGTTLHATGVLAGPMTGDGR